MGLFTAQRGPWTLRLEAVYFTLQGQGANSVTGPLGNMSVSGPWGWVSGFDAAASGVRDDHGCCNARHGSS